MIMYEIHMLERLVTMWMKMISNVYMHMKRIYMKTCEACDSSYRKKCKVCKWYAISDIKMNIIYMRECVYNAVSNEARSMCVNVCAYTRGVNVIRWRCFMGNGMSYTWISNCVWMPYENEMVIIWWMTLLIMYIVSCKGIMLVCLTRVGNEKVHVHMGNELVNTVTEMKVKKGWLPHVVHTPFGLSSWCNYTW